MASRIIAQMIMQGTAMFTRVFFAAYQEALKNAKRGGADGAGAATASFIKRKMQPDEAMKILNIEKSSLNKKSIEQQYKKFFDINDPSKGGSFYIQSKILRAKESLEKEIENSNKTK
mmetsp:Transcript_3981/g.4065  ORF Transcript_3981/g.4065 Transcript_3981/m.4065 type:complete len:117 (-) Transcript_3981:162-512(-)|eukprot:CAMPEP_0182420494 /NCGR_PEP_ID=MMETSP1167-20130531/5336_1 /TAXON_ID=2988 /ORGANISM="Mallomonas Sp, Strain CCMP3275" /LENGTH=116 /DNA_ID=CAMNT_0024596509 /DNA_START=163 /DNA_END=513 /DNA_ORIENTATION=-